ncbi:MAG: L-glutamate gamma-semialdehyde dehydrogenase, partial [Alicyclobacillaceae bacterium]|nr:L-glutamate gamma-semialdehyde dehydrogenase [Alicyclobacillaceae bacterium]
MLVDFRNEPLTDFTDPRHRSGMKKALDEVRQAFGKDYPLRINGKNRVNGHWISSIDPSRPSQIVGRVASATREDAMDAVKGAMAAFVQWSRVAPEHRARCLFKAAALMRKRKFELAAWICFEVGKNWIEADADVAEAIDFLEFYGREMVRLAQPHPLPRIHGEDNELTYEPLGVGVVIPPWNFPLAILTGMTASSIVAGNTVVLKPASASPVIAAHFVQLMEEAGVPPGVIQFLPGPGGEIGDVLVAHPQVRFVTFTGSRDVGVHIFELAAKVQPGQKWLKRVIAEMGGKDAIIVDRDADLDEAAAGIVTSAFGFAGQKCSACSRVIALADIYEPLLERVTRLTEGLRVAPADLEEASYGPVVDRKAYEKVLEYMEIGKREGQLVTGGGPAEGEGYFIQPTIFRDVPPDARIAQEEIFGPVVAFLKADTFDEAIRIANGTEYGLTGGVYSRNRFHLEQARREFHVGNLYLNRKITGALVGVHPFGGFNMSGTDSKAGGRDYLLLLTQAKV